MVVEVDSQVKSNPRNNLIYGKHHCGKGRNARGIITAGHRGGGQKRIYRKIDFRQNQKDIYGRIVTIEYDPNRNAYICLIHYRDVQISEMTESIKIIQQALEEIPGGPYENLEIRRFDRVKDIVWNEFDYRFISENLLRESKHQRENLEFL
ncbi:hypothetical protein R6Q57_016107 [Mikania cordata]